VKHSIITTAYKEIRKQKGKQVRTAAVYSVFIWGWLITTSGASAEKPVVLEAISANDQNSIARRRPIAMERLDAPSTIVIANSTPGTIGIITRQFNSVPVKHRLREYRVADQLTGMAVDGNHIVVSAIDEQGSDSIERLVRIRLLDGFPVAMTYSNPVPKSAVSAIARDGSSLVFVSRWERSASIVLGAFQQTPTMVKHVLLSFEPGKVVLDSNGRFAVVADAFGGEIAVVSMQTGQVVGQHRLDGHQIRGMMFSSRGTLKVTHQILHADVPTTADNIATGSVMENVLTELDWSSDLFGPGGAGIPFPKDLPRRIKLREVHQRELGVPSHGAADPGEMAIDHDGTTWLVLSGVNELMQLSKSGQPQQRIDVGHRPIAVETTDDSVFVLNQQDPSVSVIDCSNGILRETIPLGSSRPLTASERGERMFFDGHRSRFGWYSCQSCHPDGHTNYQLADTFADSTTGAPKRILSLLGGRDNNPWAWSGTQRSLHDQVHQSSVTTMRGDGFSARETNDMVAFLHTLDFPPPFQTLDDDSVSRDIVARGKVLFSELGCTQCHVPPLTFTSDGLFDVGMVDERGLKKFNPPSLRGVGYRRRLFHDGRATSIHDVIVEHGHQIDEAVPVADVDALVRYLKSL